MWKHLSYCVFYNWTVYVQSAMTDMELQYPITHVWKSLNTKEASVSKNYICSTQSTAFSFLTKTEESKSRYTFFAGLLCEKWEKLSDRSGGWQSVAFVLLFMLQTTLSCCLWNSHSCFTRSQTCCMGGPSRPSGLRRDKRDKKVEAKWEYRSSWQVGSPSLD